jgi:hypothetical protein
MFEQRKWKKGIYYVLSNQAETKLKKINRKKKLDELYKRCMCLYLSMNINNNLTDISMGKVNRNMTEQLNSYIKTVSNVEYLNKQFGHWKDSLVDIKAKLQKKFGEKNMSKAKNFLRVIDLMENMINLQEETVKKLIQKEKEGQDGMDIDSSSHQFNKSSLPLQFNLSDSEIYNQAIQNKFKELDLNTLSKELNLMIEEIVNEINNQDDSDIFLEMNSSMENVVTFNQGQPVGGQSGINLQIQSTPISNLSLSINPQVGQISQLNNQLSPITINKLESPTSNKLFSENDLIMNINPKQLFYDTSSSHKNSEELKSYLEKVLKVEHEKIDILPNYNYNKILSTPLDLNKDIDNFTKVYFKVFPSIYFNDDYSIDKEILESELDIYKNKYERILKDYEQNKLFNFKFNNFTTLQKLILIWGICTYGSNLHILTEIPNIFTFTKSINYESDEIFIELDKLLSDLNIDLLASNFECLSGTTSKSSPLIYVLDPPMLNSTQCSFYYNKKILNLVKSEKYDKNGQMDIDGILVGSSNVNSCNYLKNYSSGSINFNLNNKPCMSQNNLLTNLNLNISYNYNNYSRINLIFNSPVFRNPEKKKQVLSNLKEDLKKICIRVESIYENNKINNSKIDYNSMTRKQQEGNLNVRNTVNSTSRKQSHVNGVSLPTNGNTSQVTQNDPSNILLSLTNSNFDFSVKKYSDYILDATKPNIRQDTLEGVSFFSQQSIQKEWEILRTPWYQNNIQFKPKFRKPGK